MRFESIGGCDSKLGDLALDGDVRDPHGLAADPAVRELRLLEHRRT